MINQNHEQNNTKPENVYNPTRRRDSPEIRPQIRRVDATASEFEFDV